MENVISQIERAKPFFEAVSRNKYLRAIKDGFVAAMPVILFSSLFMLVAYVPNIFNFYWSETVEGLLTKPYDYTMGLLGLLVSATTAKALTGSFNRELNENTQINETSTMMASIIGFLLLSADSIEGGISSGYLGTTGLISAFISAFIVVNIYSLFIKNQVTIKMPKEVPPNIATAFEDVIPFSVAVLLIFVFETIIRNIFGTNFAQMIIEIFQPLFSITDGYLGLSIVAGAISMFWFVGIHGPSIVNPAIEAIRYSNLDNNLQLFQAGEHANNILTPTTSFFVITMGGTGATLVLPYMFMILSKSKKNKAIGKASFIPTTFGVNEPILFAGPIVLNPIYFVPFVLAPIANIWIFKLFVDVLGMTSTVYFLPWTTPAPIGIILGTGLDPLSIVLAILLIVVDVFIYYPFFKVHDNEQYELELSEQEDGSIDEKTDEKSVEEIMASQNNIEETKVLVLCAGGGTSRQLANSLSRGAEEYNANLYSAGETYGAHYDIMKNYDLVILAPQVASNYEDVKKDTDRLGIKLVKTAGQEYIGLVQDPEGALKFVFDLLDKKTE